ncbi:kynurenine 3-monooxygenase [Planobispora rosea]|uniref:Kynurenine 3-monooxygenase n=1 Tax=Planobispora rosea TaxID=35762 RepID=A0A8J3RXS1_PLARO|nr:NAD(P)/FAD-dependent oxidoreductase [Planobispora rosea]GGS69636.1 kynurenine 3-monooxygenase [Planobispora rosea]GIH83159.1 kynurenine 3-monooxygenase [Planobispora rosea]
MDDPPARPPARPPSTGAPGVGAPATGAPEVAVVGAGLVGCLLACFLARRGHAVTLYERRPDPREAGAGRSRSINLAISERGIDALRRVGLDETVLKAALPMPGRMMHAPDGTLSFQPYSADGRRAINSISRSALNRTLLDAVDAFPGVRLRFRHRLTTLDPETGRMEFDTPGGPAAAVAPVIIGADGAGSAVRARLQTRPGFNLHQEYLDYGYKELTIPARAGDFALDPGALHIWPRGRSMMIALPNPDRSFTCTLFWPERELAELDTPAKVERAFAENYPDAHALIPDLAADYALNPIGHLVTVRCEPWTVLGRAAVVGLIGDAAHAIVPFYGQGANCGFEDCVELDRCLAETGDDYAAALLLYENRRKGNTDTIARLALDNFVEMRDKVASRAFLARKRAEHLLERALPGRYASRYELISFSTVPYAEVERRVTRQRRWAAVAALAAAGMSAWAGATLRNRLRPEEPGPPGRGRSRTGRRPRAERR